MENYEKITKERERKRKVEKKGGKKADLKFEENDSTKGGRTGFRGPQRWHLWMQWLQWQGYPTRKISSAQRE